MSHFGNFEHPSFCHVSIRSDTLGPLLVVQWYCPAAMDRVFINPGAIEAARNGAVNPSITGIWDMGLRWENMCFCNNVLIYVLCMYIFILGIQI